MNRIRIRALADILALAGAAFVLAACTFAWVAQFQAP